LLQRWPAERPNHVWCWDFIFDRTTAGSQLKWLSIEDEFTRESLALKVDRSFTSEDVIDTLAELFAMRGVPAHIRSDNGPEFIAQAIGRWLAQLDVETLYIEPGAPWENGYAESFHSRFRDECLATEEFENVTAATCVELGYRSAGVLAVELTHWAICQRRAVPLWNGAAHVGSLCEPQSIF
jgi:transposase InsO family protein